MELWTTRGAVEQVSIVTLCLVFYQLKDINAENMHESGVINFSAD